MSTKHTPEPWMHLQRDRLIYTKLNDGCRGRAVAELVNWWTEEHLANARRIVSCVNAMAGIENPQKLRETWEAVKHLELDQAQKYKEQRDTLLEAYKLLLPSMYSGMLTTDQVKILEAAEKIWEEIEQNGK